MAFLSLDRVNKAFGDGKAQSDVLRAVNLEVEAGEFVAVIALPQSGKSALLQLIAGMTQPDSGSIKIAGKRVEGPGLDRGVAFQSDSLLPWLSVFENVALAADKAFSEWPAPKRRARGLQYLTRLGLGPELDKKPSELSPPARRRVALARALATNPELLLLDEPLAGLDRPARTNLQRELEDLHRTEKKTVLMTTENVDEALLLADRVLPLTPGPCATLGPAFAVGLRRPRCRIEVEGSDEYQGMRRDLVSFLTAFRRRRPELQRPNDGDDDGDDDGDGDFVAGATLLARLPARG